MSTLWFSPHHSRVSGFVKSGKAHVPGQTTLWYSVAVLGLAVEVALAALDVDGVVLVYLHAGVDDGHDVEALLVQVGDQALGVGEPLSRPR